MKRGGSAEKLFEFLKERNSGGSTGSGARPARKESSPRETKPLPPPEPKPGTPRPTLLLGGIEGRLPDRPTTPGATSLKTPDTKKPLPARKAIGHYRGKAFVMKYDVALVVVLALTGLLVISWVWGYHGGYAAGKSEGIRIAAASGERRDMSGSSSSKSDGTGRAGLVQPPITDDGTGDYRIKLISMGSHTSANRRYFEEHAETLKNKEHYPSVRLDRSASHIALYVGRFKSKESAERHIEHFRAKDKAYKECYVTRRP